LKKLNERVAVITGGASGIGLGTAHELAAAGMKLVLADVEGERLQAAVRSLEESGATVLGVETDVSDAGKVEALAKKTLQAFGGVHVLCNNAGVGYGGRAAWDVPPEAWQWVIGVNLMGVVHGMHAFIPIMLEQKTEAHVVNTASLAGLIVNFFTIPYGVTKHAVVALSESTYVQLKMAGASVGISVLCPGPINTDILNSSQRNRPAAVLPPPEPTPREAVLRYAYTTWLERGLDPREVGRQVLQAIHEERFYIITHDFDNSIERRMRTILQRENPEPAQPSPDLLEILQGMKDRSK
jgi:NAD(P)-dependent dehydrogenase (short-subunit alcohol dehydrogenase family)